MMDEYKQLINGNISSLEDESSASLPNFTVAIKPCVASLTNWTVESLLTGVGSKFIAIPLDEALYINLYCSEKVFLTA